MEETTMTAAAETTAPQEDSAPQTVETKTATTTTSAAPADAALDGAQTDATPAADASPAQENAAAAPAQAGEPPAQGEPCDEEASITYRFNHRTERMSVSEAPAYIQKGKRLDTLAPQLDRLQYIAEARGKTLGDLIGELEQSFEQSERQALLRQCGGNEETANRLYDLQKAERMAGYKSFSKSLEEEETAERDEMNRRMGEQLSQLQREFPEIKDFAALPQEAVKEAVEQDIPLLDAYLRYRHRNGRRAEEAKQQQAKADAAGAGTLKSAPDPAASMDEQSRGFLATFRKNMYG